MRTLNAVVILEVIIIAMVASMVLGPVVFAQGPSPTSVQLPSGSAGVKTCESCHEEVLTKLGKTSMGRLFLKHPRTPAEQLVCETCHGSGQIHADSQGEKFDGLIRFSKGSPTPIQKRDEACLQCHQKIKRLAWDGSPHQMRDIACTSCHSVHKGGELSPKLLSQPTEMELCNQCHKRQVAQQMSFSHMPLREGKMDCSSCHNPHGSFSPKLVKGNSTNDLCYSCHKEKRGPFLFEHPPVSEDCSNCHNSHGGNYPRMLKTPEIRLCRQCHVNFHSLDAPGRHNKRQLIGRACTDCHFNIHGSNAPTATGKLFIR
jgi:DmsE family decaheme c-type cytochrome